MTYCLGMLLDAGLVMIADTRTNAGIDNIHSYRKLHCLADEPGRQVYAATAGNLSVSQTVISLVKEGLPAEEEGRMGRTLAQASSMFRAAQLVGEALQAANKTVGEALAALNIPGSASILLGGRIGAGPPSLYQIYEAGNFIECRSELPFFQIGETKYGRPILDRILKRGTPLGEAVKLGFLSFDSAMRSNLAVGRPLDIMVMPAEPDAPVLTQRIDGEDRYFNDLSVRWALLLKDAADTIPDPPFLAGLA
jgi:putative proteasome-type protease